MSYKEYEVFIDYQEYKNNPLYLESLKKHFDNKIFKNKDMLYVIKFNEFITWKAIGAFTESSLIKLKSKLDDYIE